MSVFQVVKESVNIVDAAQKYGLEVSRHKKAICPFHQDTNPSLSFKDKRYTCFSCGAKGDVIDLVGYLIHSRSAIDTVKELNHTYHLGIELDRPPDSRYLRQMQRAREEKAAFEAWEKDACIVYAQYCRTLRKWKKLFAPRTMDSAPHPLFLEACTQMDYVEYLYDEIFIKGSIDDKKRFFLSHRTETAALKQRLGREDRDGAVGRAEAGNLQNRRDFIPYRDIDQVV